MKKFVIFIAVFSMLLASFAATQPAAAANSGVTAQIVDGKTAQGWIYGAEILVIQISGTNVGLKGSATLAADGTFTIIFPTADNTGMTDTLGLCGNLAGQMGDCTPVNNFSSLQILINFNCDFETTNTGLRSDFDASTDAACPTDTDVDGNPALSLVGLPGNFEKSFTDTFTAIVRQLGDIDTNRGPTALELVEFSVNSPANNNAWLPYVLLLGSVVLVSGAVALLRKRRA